MAQALPSDLIVSLALLVSVVGGRLPDSPEKLRGISRDQACACVRAPSDSFATPWAVAHQAPLSMGFPRQECWRALTFPYPGDLPDPGIKPVSSALQVDSLPI